MNRKNVLLSLIVILILFIGFWFRLNGISTNHSFWSDEAFISDISKEVIFGKQTLLDGLSQSSYQSLHILITAISFLVFGESEFSARFPTVLFGVLGIFFAFLVAKKLSNWSGGFLAAFLMAFSQINLTNSTQAKPYAVIQMFLLIEIYLLLRLKKLETKLDKPVLNIYGAVVMVGLVASLFHTIGVLLFIPLLVDILIRIKNKSIQMFIVIIGASFFLYIIKFNFFPNNHLIYFKNLLLKQYGVYFLPALLGIFILFNKYRNLMIGITLYLVVLIYLWIFQNYTHNIRYLVSLFGLIFVFFGVFWSKIADLLNLKFPSFAKASEGKQIINFKLLPILILINIYLSGYKIVRTPQTYYSPNLDLYGDVQNADYKTMYTWIGKKYGKNLNNIAIFNDLIDSERFYLSRNSDAYFMKNRIKPYKHPFNNAMIYGNLNSFLVKKSKYSKGILIIEDWDSYLPEDIKQYAKKNMKLEYRVEKMEVGGERDIWPLEVRSWGM